MGECLLGHLIVAVITASLVTMFMLARPLLWLRKWVHRVTRWGESSWGVCGYCACLPASIITVLVFGLHWEGLLIESLQNVWTGRIVSLIFVHLVAAFVHFGYMRLTGIPIEYPSLEGGA